MVLDRNMVLGLILLALCAYALIGLGILLVQMIVQFAIIYPIPAIIAVGAMALVWKAQDSEEY